MSILGLKRVLIKRIMIKLKTIKEKEIVPGFWKICHGDKMTLAFGK